MIDLNVLDLILTVFDIIYSNWSLIEYVAPNRNFNRKSKKKLLVFSKMRKLDPLTKTYLMDFHRTFYRLLLAT